MNLSNRFCQKLLPVIGICALLAACNSSQEVPFPEKDLGYAQPVSAPLLFNKPTKIKWKIAREGGVKPVLKKLDIAASAAATFDTNLFRPFLKAPEEVSFDINSIPEKKIDLSALPSKKLQFKTTLLPAIPAVTALKPVLQKNRSISVSDFGQAQGLPASFVTYLHKEKDGLMLVGSKVGLFSYDGQEIKTLLRDLGSGSIIGGVAKDRQGRFWYIKNDNTLGVIDPKKGTSAVSSMLGGYQNNLTNMTLDQHGNIWLYNQLDRAVSIIDPETGTYRNLSVKNGLADTTAFQVMEDLQKNIWISGGNKGITLINPEKGTIKYIKKENGLSSDTLTAITEDKNGHIWVASAKSGLNEIDLKAGKIKHYQQAQGVTPQYKFHLFFDSKDYLWVAGQGEALVLDLMHNQYKSLLAKDGLNGGNLLSIAEDLQGRIWLGGNQGLNIVDQTGASTHLFGNTQVISIMQDVTGDIWIATDKGLKVVDPEKNQIRSFTKANGLGDNFVQSFSNRHGKMWVTSDGGLDIIDPVRKTLEHTGKAEGLVNDTVYSVFPDNAGNTWITGPSTGISLIDSAKKMILHTDRSLGLSDNTILDVKEDDKGRIWFANNTKGVDVLDPSTNIIQNLNNQPGLQDVCSKVILKDPYGRMWISSDKGIYVVDNTLSTITPITTKEGLTSNRVLSLLQYKDKVLAATDRAVQIITAPIPPYAQVPNKGDTTWKIETLRKSVSLIRATLNAWATDGITKDGHFFWGDLGMFIIPEFKAETDSFPTYITGLNIMAAQQVFIDKHIPDFNDTLWTADSFYLRGQKPLYTGYASIPGLSWDSVAGPYNMPVNLVIPYTSNYLQFQYAQANAGRRDTTWYTYTLEGIDKKWSAPTASTTSENYLNLPPGHYTFKVSSRGLDGRWSVPATFSFTIAPPWYKTWWAYLIFILLGIGVLRTYIVYRSRMLQKENRVLEEKVTHRTAQLQKSLEDLKATQTQLIQSEKMASLGELTAGIAHEIQNPLNFINNFSEVNTELIEEMEQEIQKGNLSEVQALAKDIKENEQKITFHGKRADGIVKGMLQHSRNNSGAKEPTNVNTLADEYLRLAYHGLRAKDKSFNATMQTDFDEHIGTINIVAQDIGRVILNLITNAFYAVTDKKKKGIEGYVPTVYVGTKRTQDKIIITVRDNGMGIPQKVIDKIFQPFFSTKPTGEGTGLGLSMSYDIVTKVHHGELLVSTVEGESAEFKVVLPIQQS